MVDDGPTLRLLTWQAIRTHRSMPAVLKRVGMRRVGSQCTREERLPLRGIRARSECRIVKVRRGHHS